MSMRPRTFLFACMIATGLIAAAVAGDDKDRKDKPLPTTPQDFLIKALDCSLAEKGLAEKAATKATNQDVRQFAQRLADDHTKMNYDLMAMASDLKVAVAGGASKEHKEALLDLLKARGDEFDRKFIKLM